MEAAPRFFSDPAGLPARVSRHAEARRTDVAVDFSPALSPGPGPRPPLHMADEFRFQKNRNRFDGAMEQKEFRTRMGGCSSSTRRHELPRSVFDEAALCSELLVSFSRRDRSSAR